MKQDDKLLWIKPAFILFGSDIFALRLFSNNALNPLKLHHSQVFVDTPLETIEKPQDSRSPLLSHFTISTEIWVSVTSIHLSCGKKKPKTTQLFQQYTNS